MLSTTKRKNDTPVNRWRAWLLMGVILALVIGLMVYRMTQFQRNSSMPAAPLVYVQTTGERYALDLQTGERSLTNSGGPHYREQILPDGQWQISSWRFTPQQSYVTERPLALQRVDNPQMYLDTGRLTNGDVTWSSDSQWIVFSSRAANCFSDHLDSPYTELPATPRQPEEFCLKDDLTGIDYAASELWLFNVHTTEARALTDNDVIEGSPLFSPRQPQVIYKRAGSLYLYDVETSQDRLLFSDASGGEVGQASWSPDALWIAFTVTVSKNARDLYIIRPDGTEAQRVAINVNTSYGFHWVP